MVVCSCIFLSVFHREQWRIQGGGGVVGLPPPPSRFFFFFFLCLSVYKNPADLNPTPPPPPEEFRPEPPPPPRRIPRSAPGEDGLSCTSTPQLLLSSLIASGCRSIYIYILHCQHIHEPLPSLYMSIIVLNIY